METREIILDILQEMHEDIDYEKEKALVTDKILDSFDLVSLDVVSSKNIANNVAPESSFSK